MALKISKETLVRLSSDLSLAIIGGQNDRSFGTLKEPKEKEVKEAKEGNTRK